MRMVCDGLFLVSDYEEWVEEVVVYRGHGVYGWDGSAERYTMHWFDTMAGAPTRAVPGVWEGQTLTFWEPWPQKLA